MNSRCLARLMALIVLLLALPVVAEDLPKVSTEEAMKHVTKSVQAKYPVMASTANIQGKVLVEATISPEGKVSHVHLISGHPLLAQPALDAVRQWKFLPFALNGQAVTVQTTLPVLFYLGPDADLEDKYHMQLTVCAEQLQAQRYNEAGATCNEALESGKRIKNDYQRIEGYKYAARAAFYLNHYDDAAQLFQERLRLAGANLPGDDPELFKAHLELATAWFRAGKLDKADEELTATEKQLSVMQESLDHHRGGYTAEALSRNQSDLNENSRDVFQHHAQILRKLGRNSEAEAMEKKAAEVK